jgi:phosphoglycolate phosphatase-like HAD superfamily hydrolase
MPVSSRTPIAVFDLDGTLVDGQSGSLFSIYLLKHGVINLPRAARLVWWGARYKLHLPQRQDEPREVIMAALNRSHPDDIAQIMREFHAEEMVPRYRQSMIEEVKPEDESVMLQLNRVIPGWTEGMQLFGEGGKGKLFVPSNLGYGENGHGAIEPNATLVFDIQLDSVKRFVPKEQE